MVHRKHVQLIDKIDIPSGVILNLWDIDERVQLSVEIDNPVGKYKVGEVFVVNRAAMTEDLALERSTERVDSKSLLIPRKNATKTSGFAWRMVIKNRYGNFTRVKVPYGPSSSPGAKRTRLFAAHIAKLRAAKAAKASKIARAAKAKRSQGAGVGASKRNVFSGEIIK